CSISLPAHSLDLCQLAFSPVNAGDQSTSQARLPPPTLPTASHEKKTEALDNLHVDYTTVATSRNSRSARDAVAIVPRWAGKTHVQHAQLLNGTKSRRGGFDQF